MNRGTRPTKWLAEQLTLVPGAERLLVSLGHRLPNCRLVAALCFHFGNAVAETSRGSERLARVARNSLLRITLDEHMFRSIYFLGTHERETSGLLKKLVQPGEFWLDVGANIGLFTITLAELVGPQGAVLAFEPNPVLAARLSRSVADNKLTNVAVRAVAVGERRGTAQLHVPINAGHTPGGSGRASLIQAHAIGETECVDVDVVTIDEEVAHRNAIDGIKIDVEGYEAAVFRGMERTLAQRPPKTIVFEAIRTSSALASPNSLMQMLEQFGYECFHVPSGTRLNSSEPYVGGLSDNILAVRADLAPTILKRCGLQPR
jgi:FkbM family methyltransferase